MKLLVRTVRMLVVAGVLLTLTGLGPLAHPAAPAQSADPTAPPQSAPPEPSPPEPLPPERSQPQVVSVGIYVQTISDIDLRSGTFQADFYLWFRWRGDLDPTKTYEFTNALPLQLSSVAGATAADGSAEAEILEDGSRYQLFHVNGRFLSRFDTDNYPLDDADLRISIEDVKNDATTLVYEYDPASSMSENLRVTGREVRPPVGQVTEHRYSTTFGYPGTEQGDVVFSQLDMSLEAGRPSVSLVLQSIFPLVVVVFAAMASLLIESPVGEGGDSHWWWLATRLSLAVPAVIAAVALQFTASTGIPREGQVLLIDRIYLLSYTVILAVIAITVITHRSFRRGTSHRTRAVDRWSLFSLIPLFLGGIFLILVLR